MLELEDIKSKISDIEKRIEEANYNERELESAKADFRNNRKEFEARFAAVRLGNSTNPFEIRKKDEEEAKLKDREEKLDEEEKEIKDEKLGLKQEFDEFVSELAGNIQKEKDRINAEAQNPEISLNMLNDEKQKLISDKEMYLKRIAEWEENNINPNDVLYKRLKEELVPKVDTRIAEIDKELEELEPEKLSEMYNELEKYENVVKNLHTWDYKIKEMCQVFDVKTQEQIRQEEAERQRQEAEAERQRQEAEAERQRQEAEKQRQEAAERQAKFEAKKKEEERKAGELMPQAMEYIANKLVFDDFKFNIVDFRNALDLDTSIAVKIHRILKEKGVIDDGHRINEEKAKEVLKEYGIDYEESAKGVGHNETAKSSEPVEGTELAEIEKGLSQKAAQILKEEIELMGEDLESSVAKFQEPNNDKIGRDSHTRTGTTPLNSGDIEPQKKSTNGSSKPKTEIPMTEEEYSDYLYEHMTKVDKEFEIEIGETAVIYREQKALEPKVLKDYKKAAKLNEAYEKNGINAFSEKIINELKYISEDVLDIIKDCSDNKVPIDFMVIFAIKDNQELNNVEKYNLMYEYLVNNLKAYYNYSKVEKSDDNIEKNLSKYEKFGSHGNLAVTYNMNELSETHLSALLPMSNKLNGRQKEKIASLANKFQRLGTAITTGKYEEKSIIAKILNFKPFKKVKRLFLPEPEKMSTPDYDTSYRYKKTMISEEELEAAYQYNDILEKSAPDKYKSMRENMEENIKNNIRADVRLSPEELKKVEATAKARAEEYKNAGDTKKANKLEELAETHSKQTQNHNKGSER